MNKILFTCSTFAALALPSISNATSGFAAVKDLQQVKSICADAQYNCLQVTRSGRGLFRVEYEMPPVLDAGPKRDEGDNDHPPEDPDKGTR